MMKALAFGAAAVVAAGLGATAWYVMQPASDDPFAACRDGVVQGGLSQIGGSFELVNSQGETVTDTDVITMPSLIYFGYTFCPDVCPLDMSNNSLATEILEEQGHIVQPVFISIDPARDTPELVGEFAQVNHPRAIGLTGSEEQVRAASQAYRTYFRAHDTDDEFYLVDHSAFSYVVLPEHGTAEVLRHNMSAEERAEAVQCILESL